MTCLALVCSVTVDYFSPIRINYVTLNITVCVKTMVLLTNEVLNYA